MEKPVFTEDSPCRDRLEQVATLNDGDEPESDGGMALDLAFNETTILTAGVILAAGVGGIYHFLHDRTYAHETGSAYGQSSWAKTGDLKRTGLFNTQGIIVGRLNGKLLRHKTDKHLMTLAPNRSGKGVSSIIPNLLT